MNKPIAVFSNLDMLEKRVAATFALAARGRYHPRLPVSEPGYLIAMSRPLILASTSCYRKALLEKLGLPLSAPRRMSMNPCCPVKMHRRWWLALPMPRPVPSPTSMIRD